MSGIIKVTIKLKSEDMDMEEKNEIIVSSLKLLAGQLEETKGNIQQAKFNDEFSKIEYHHLTSK